MKYYSINQAARILGYSRVRVYQLIKEKKLKPANNIEADWDFISDSEIQRFKKENPRKYMDEKDMS